MDATDRITSMEAARAEFLASGYVERAVVGNTILRSWHRSRVAGVDIDSPKVPYDQVDIGSRLVRCATPVIDRLYEQLDGLPASIVLTDEQGRLIDRKDRSRELARHFDTVYFAPGFNYAEAHVGTNGVGTALEDGHPVFVSGAEHFNERSGPFACAGAPIRNPLTRRVEGLIDLSCLYQDAHPMMRVLAQESARAIEGLLLEDGSERQRLALQHFLTTCRSSSGAVVSVSGDVVMSNERASELLTPADEALLRQFATDIGNDAPYIPTEISLTGQRWAHVRCHPVAHGTSIAGTVFELHLRDATSRHKPTRQLPTRSRLPVTLLGVSGRSHAWIEAATQVRDSAKNRTPLVVDGEPGVGKLTLIEGVHRDLVPTDRLAVIECENESHSPLTDMLGADRTPAPTMVLRHLDRLSSERCDEMSALLASLAQQDDRPWIVATACAPNQALETLLAHFGATVTVPPLRHRLDDLHELVPMLLNQLAPKRKTDCTDDAMRILSRNIWPGNVTELREGLRTAIRNRPAGPIRPEDLPPTCFTTSRRTLTVMEERERDTIISALIDARDNRKEAAASLGISRSSLYRKIHNYGISKIATQADPPLR